MFKITIDTSMGFNLVGKSLNLMAESHTNNTNFFEFILAGKSYDATFHKGTRILELITLN